eukprot:148310-Rhodomonas_salina.3
MLRPYWRMPVPEIARTVPGCYVLAAICHYWRSRRTVPGDSPSRSTGSDPSRVNRADTRYPW